MKFVKKGYIVIILVILIITPLFFVDISYNTNILRGISNNDINNTNTDESLDLLARTSRGVSSSRVSKPTGSGPHSTRYYSTNIPRVNDTSVPARIYYPSAGNGSIDPTAAPYSGIVWAPGAGGYETAYYTELSIIASWGFIVTIVGTGGPCNQEVVDLQSYVLDYYEALNSNSSSIFHNNIDTSGYGASGHSNGGWAAIAGGVADARYAAICPVMGAAGPTMFQGQANTQNLHIPLQLMAGADDTTFIPSSNAYYDYGNPIKSYIILQGSGHGGPFHLEYLIAFYKYWLDNELEYSTFTYGENIFADEVAGSVQFKYDVGLSASPDASDTDVYEDEEIILTGTGEISEPTGPDREIALYKWDLDADGNFDMNYSTPPEKINISYTDEGDYEVKFSVKDSWGMMAFATLFFTVNNKKPTAIADQDKVAFEDELIQFDASDSYDTISDNPTLEYKWEFGDDLSSNWQSEMTVNHMYTQQDNYTVRLFVRDDNEEIDSDVLKVTVKNVPPIAIIGDFKEELKIGEMVYFNANNSTDTESDLNTLTFTWTFGDSKTATGISASHSYDDEGEYTVSLIAMDDDGARSTVSDKIKVLNSPPYCTAMDKLQAEEDETITFSGSGGDTKSDENNLLYSWAVGVPGVPDSTWSTTTEFEYSYTVEGEYLATLTVKDDDGATASSSVIITVRNVEPNAKFSSSSSVIDEDKFIFFDASDSRDTKSDQDSLNYSWDFDDGTPTSYGKEVEHMYHNSGQYKVELTVTDDNGAINSYSKKITVRNVKPEADITVSSVKAIVGEEISFSAKYSWDSPSDIEYLTYSWSFGDRTFSTDESVWHNYSTPRSYTVTLTVTDDDGDEATAEVDIWVAEPPKIELASEPTTEKDDDNILLGSITVLSLIIILIILIIVSIIHNRKIKQKSVLEPTELEEPIVSQQSPPFQQEQMLSQPQMYEQYQTQPYIPPPSGHPNSSSYPIQPQMQMQPQQEPLPTTVPQQIQQPQSLPRLPPASDSELKKGEDDVEVEEPTQKIY